MINLLSQRGLMTRTIIIFVISVLCISIVNCSKSDSAAETVKQYYECEIKKDGKCFLSVYSDDYIKREYGNVGRVAEIQEEIMKNSETKSYKIVKVDETDTMADVKASSIFVDLANNTQINLNQTFKLLKINGKWRINARSVCLLTNCG